MAIALMGVVILGVTSFDMGSRQFLQSSERKTQVLNEAAFIMDSIAKDALLAVGDKNNNAITRTKNDFPPDIHADVVRINQDTDQDGIVDRIITYKKRTQNSEIIKMIDNDPAQQTVISNRGYSFEVGAVVPGRNTVQIAMRLRFDPATNMDPFNNPEVRLQSSIEVPGWSLN